MFFNSWEFFGFFAVFILLFSWTKGTVRLWVNLLSSYFFYAWWDWRFLGLVAFITLMGFYTGLLISDSPNNKRRKQLLVFSIATSLVVLGFFKYFNFFYDSLNTLIGVQPTNGTFKIILPIGISFYTFQSISYSIDLYRGAMEAERSLLRYATFLSFFPHVVAGPIVRGADFLPQLRTDPTLDWTRVRHGFRLILIGLVLKCAIADSLAVVVDPCFARPALQSTISVAIAVVFYSFQIYCDFSGYSLMAIGIAKVLGYNFLKNFDRPYFSSSFSEFWTRWHISLSSWLRDYLYIPLGGNRLGEFRTYVNLMITMILGGLWHGASWNFVIWGVLHGGYLVIQRLVGTSFRQVLISIRVPVALIHGLSVVTVFLLSSLAWIYFRSPTNEIAIQLLGKLAVPEGLSFGNVGGKFYIVKGCVLIVGLILVEWISFRIDFAKHLQSHPAWDVAIFCGSVLLLALLGTFGNSSFIYFQF